MSVLRFSPITLSHKDLFIKIMERVKSSSCQMCFSNLWCLQEKYGTEICIQQDIVFIRQLRRMDKGYTAYFPPFGKDVSLQAYQDIEETAKRDGHQPYLFGLTESHRKEGLLPVGMVIEENTDWTEYLYYNEKLKNYRGNGMALKRRDARSFWRHYGEGVRIEPICGENIGEILQFQKQWMYRYCERKEKQQQLLWEDKAIKRALYHFVQLDLQGLAFRIDGAIAAYSYGAWLNGQTFDLCVQKADYSYRNINQAMISALAVHCCPQARYMNFEEDLGIFGLRRMKLSYKPDWIYKKYNGFWQKGGCEHTSLY